LTQQTKTEENMKTLNTQLQASDTNAMQALKVFVSNFITYKSVKSAMEFVKDYIDSESDLNDFETLLKEFKAGCQTVIVGKWNDLLSQIEIIELNRTQIGL